MTLSAKIGPALEFDRAKTQPLIFPFVDEDDAPLDLTGKTLVFRIGTRGETALYELELAPVGDPANGEAGGNVDADIAPSKSYAYHVEYVEGDRILIKGACSVVAVIGAMS
ncbi:MAG: hypothetical protein IT385_29430 [Deltaproteobacteria bacterium]|nr:hypothetical protein [Deltaproteobacteria bacterium]